MRRDSRRLSTTYCTTSASKLALRFTLSSSDVGLQRLLYASLFTAGWFGATLVGATAWKLAYLDLGFAPFTRVGTPVFVSLWVLAEASRLRLGYAGNLGERVRAGARGREVLPAGRPNGGVARTRRGARPAVSLSPPRAHPQVPEATAFWLLTLLPTLPLTLFLAFFAPSVTRMELGAGVLHTALLVLQLRAGLRAVRGFIRKQTVDFYRLCMEEALTAATAGRRRQARAADPPRARDPAAAVPAALSFAPALDVALDAAAAAAEAGLPLPPDAPASVGSVVGEGLRAIVGAGAGLLGGGGGGGGGGAGSGGGGGGVGGLDAARARHRERVAALAGGSAGAAGDAAGAASGVGGEGKSE